MFEKFRFHHFFGMMLALILAAILAFFPMLLQLQGSDAPSSTLTIFFVFVLAFLMNNAIQKSHELRQNINIELSRLRRLHHLAEKIGDSKVDTEFRVNIEKGIESYLEYLKKNSLAKYKEARGAFRGITFSVYAYEPSTTRGREFVKELFTTTRELALTRQQMIALLDRRISSYGWSILFVIETLVIISILLTQAPGLISYFVSMSTIATIFIITLMVYEVDDNSKIELKEFGLRYGNNLNGLTYDEHSR
ncbi:hypothetical protein COY25_03890 [Candidatus Uhrbacteria bacterium CG_4_10_14_0_2_um_filter_41_7]|nr:MAG: hypothetical protein COV92_02625 [Candidatus Uhrbacteria bacterium CG11_big_fil_rev_8_21_14_0_20_41_9]PIZ53171.1 MAG: hypothetical protein COY25_03890 [Candidatus Uhrbacteria bacterium CG_4_10_14_0_2_um_filter_41_7]